MARVTVEDCLEKVENRFNIRLEKWSNKILWDRVLGRCNQN